MSEKNRIRVDFCNGDQRIAIWMTEGELKRMLTKDDAWEAKAWQSDVDRLQKTSVWHSLWLKIYGIAIMVLFIAGLIMHIGG